MTSPVPFELQQKITDWRLRAADGTLTIEEMKAAVLYLRQGRVAAATAATKRKKSSVAPAAEDMLSDLESM